MKSFLLFSIMSSLSLADVAQDYERDLTQLNAEVANKCSEIKSSIEEINSSRVVKSAERDALLEKKVDLDQRMNAARNVVNGLAMGDMHLFTDYLKAKFVYEAYKERISVGLYLFDKSKSAKEALEKLMAGSSLPADSEFRSSLVDWLYETNEAFYTSGGHMAGVGRYVAHHPEYPANSHMNRPFTLLTQAQVRSNQILRLRMLIEKLSTPPPYDKKSAKSVYKSSYSAASGHGNRYFDAVAVFVRERRDRNFAVDALVAMDKKLGVVAPLPVPRICR